VPVTGASDDWRAFSRSSLGLGNRARGQESVVGGALLSQKPLDVAAGVVVDAASALLKVD